MDLQEMTNYIKTRYPTELMEHEIGFHLNEIYRDVSTLFTPDTTETTTISTVVSQEIYEMDELSRTIKQILYDDVRLRTMMAESLRYPRGIDATPLRWYPFGFREVTAGGVYQVFGLDPVPDAIETMTIYYEPIPEMLIASDDEPEYIPDEMHYLVCWGTLAILAGNQQDYNTSQYWEAKYRAAYNEKLVQLGRSRYANFPEAARKVKGI